jgi:hypothetical protein
MKREVIQLWYEQLLARARTLPKHGDGIGYPKEEPARAWATEAESALAATFADAHPTRQAWARELKHPAAEHIAVVVANLRSVFKGAAALVRDNRLGSFVDAIRIDSEK